MACSDPGNQPARRGQNRKFRKPQQVSACIVAQDDHAGSASPYARQWVNNALKLCRGVAVSGRTSRTPSAPASVASPHHKGGKIGGAVPCAGAAGNLSQRYTSACVIAGVWIIKTCETGSSPRSSIRENVIEHLGIYLGRAGTLCAQPVGRCDERAHVFRLFRGGVHQHSGVAVGLCKRVITDVRTVAGHRSRRASAIPIARKLLDGGL